MARVTEDQITDSHIGDVFPGGYHCANRPVARYEGIVNLLQTGQFSQFGAGADQAVPGLEQDIAGSKIKLFMRRLQDYAVNSSKNDFPNINLGCHLYLFALSDTACGSPGPRLHLDLKLTLLLHLSIQGFLVRY